MNSYGSTASCCLLPSASLPILIFLSLSVHLHRRQQGYCPHFPLNPSNLCLTLLNQLFRHLNSSHDVECKSIFIWGLHDTTLVPHSARQNHCSCPNQSTMKQSETFLQSDTDAYLHM
ncbi:hypothetical protein L2E82_34689 [Cichorium intybus]|uniref:Uncharacterized protein n=1 Tax=Cichorium intybus TaxID=13427 RepID=A0ACB9BMM2_CICIN|nr:hypothetical protein L2E82_34689 [Cichorium intybus]